MHSAVMQNDDYIKFANDNTVEVLALGRLDEAVQKNDKADQAKIARYKATVNGKEVELMVEWPNLTYEEIIALNQSPAGQYNKSGGIPYTSIVNPWDLKEMWKQLGGTSASTIMAAATDAKKQLEKEHGKGLSRKDLRAFNKADADATKLTNDGEFSKAIQAYDPFTKPSALWPQDMKTRLEKARNAVVEAATSKLEEIESKAGTDAVGAKKDLDKLMLKLGKTGLEPKAKELAQKLATGG